MKIHILDGPPGLGTTELVRQIALQPTSRNILCIPKFSKQVTPDSITIDSISTMVESSIHDLIDRIDIAEKSKYSTLFIDGSPISYVAYSEFMNVQIDDSINKKVNILCSLIQNYTKVSLRLPSSGFHFSQNINTISPREIYSLGEHLKKEYSKRFRTRVKMVGAQ